MNETKRIEAINTLFLLFIIWNLFDMGLTIIGVTSNTAHEANPVLAGMTFGYAMLFKMSLALLVACWWLIRGSTWKLVVGNVLIYGVCIWNIMVLQGVI